MTAATNASLAAAVREQIDWPTAVAIVAICAFYSFMGWVLLQLVKKELL